MSFLPSMLTFGPPLYLMKLEELFVRNKIILVMWDTLLSMWHTIIYIDCLTVFWCSQYSGYARFARAFACFYFIHSDGLSSQSCSLSDCSSCKKIRSSDNCCPGSVVLFYYSFFSPLELFHHPYFKISTLWKTIFQLINLKFDFGMELCPISPKHY